MGFVLKGLQVTVAVQGRVVRVVVCAVDGSTPREVGAAMLVWEGGQSGTIGGGELEFRAAGEARAMLAGGEARAFTTQALGPDLGQCCGGRVSLLTEVFDAQSLCGLTTEVDARPAHRGGPVDTPPLPVARMCMRAHTHTGRQASAAHVGNIIQPAVTCTLDAGHDCR